MEGKVLRRVKVIVGIYKEITHEEIIRSRV